MDVKLVLFIITILTLLACQVEAGLYLYNFNPLKEKLKGSDLKCNPGHTVIKIQEKVLAKSDDDYSEEETRRTHMDARTDDETCKICVCSVEGKDEYCSRRPARNVNECIRLSILNKRLESNVPFSHDSALAYRIRRDYIWHYDEIPYEPKASCKRGTSYYTNSETANNTDIDVASDIDSLLDYSNTDICFYCVCSLDGRHASCMSRDPFYCEYYRIIRNPNAQRDRYRELFRQDRPAYFRQLSHRIRRVMDDGVFTLVDAGGDALCCNHPDGHRRTLHQQVRNKIRQMRRKVPKENILEGSPQGDYVDFIVNND